MHAWKRSKRLCGTIALAFQLVLVVGVPFADASHAGVEVEGHAHVEEQDAAPCSPGHSPDCQLARVLSTGGVPIPTGLAVVVSRVELPLVRPADADLVRDDGLISSHGPRAPPTL